MTIIRVLVPAHLEEGFKERFKKAIRRTEWVSASGKYIEFLLEEFNKEDIEELFWRNFFWKTEEGNKNFYD